MLLELLERHLELFNDANSDRRRMSLDQVYSEKLVFLDPHARAEGLVEMNALVDGLHTKFPGFRLEHLTPVDEHHGVMRFRWVLHRQNDSAVYGTDFVKFQDEKISEIVVFFDKAG